MVGLKVNLEWRRFAVWIIRLIIQLAAVCLDSIFINPGFGSGREPDARLIMFHDRDAFVVVSFCDEDVGFICYRDDWIHVGGQVIVAAPAA